MLNLVHFTVDAFTTKLDLPQIHFYFKFLLHYQEQTGPASWNEFDLGIEDFTLPLWFPCAVIYLICGTHLSKFESPSKALLTSWLAMSALGTLIHQLLTCSLFFLLGVNVSIRVQYYCEVIHSCRWVSLHKSIRF